MSNAAGTLVIGIGNPLRGDDAIGLFVARAVTDWRAANIEALEVHQLLPEHAALLEKVARVIFVDALNPEYPAPSTLLPIRLVPESASSNFSHQLVPCQLLALTQTLWGRAPEAWLLAVPVEALAVAQGLSEFAQTNATIALRLIAALVAGPGPGECVASFSSPESARLGHPSLSQ